MDTPRLFLPLVLALVAIAGCASAGDESVDAFVGGADARPAADGATIDADSSPADAAALGDGQLADAGLPAGDAGSTGTDGGTTTMANDTCATAIDLTAAALMVGGATVAGTTIGYVDDLQPPAACTDDFLLDGADAVYRVTATAGQTISATVTPANWDTSIYILSSCSTPISAAACLAGADAIAGNGVESVSTTVAGPGTFYVVVDGWNPGVEGDYSLQVTLN